VSGRFPSGCNRSFARFALLYTLLLAGVYSAIPYKTPWCALNILFGMILLAGIGAATLIEFMHNLSTRLAGYVLIGVLIFFTAWQAFRMNFVYHSDGRNPWTYVQTVPDILECATRIADIAAITPEGNDILIQVIAPPDQIWPLPWYLKGYSRTGYWTGLDETSVIEDVPVLITSVEIAVELLPELEQKYMIEYYGVREDVLLALYIRKDLWNTFLESRE